jgi:hypothetical protein
MTVTIGRQELLVALDGAACGGARSRVKGRGALAC